MPKLKIKENGFTPTQRKMLDILRDGRAHADEELLSCLEASAAISAVWVHISGMRDCLHRQGIYIGRYARHFRLLRQIEQG